MLRLRLKNVAVSHGRPIKRRIERKTERHFQTICLPQENGSFVASVVEAPEIVVYDRSRSAAESRAARAFLKSPDTQGYKRHPLATSRAVTIDMEHDEDAQAFVTYVKELHGMSTFGETESLALDSTGEMIRGYIKSMEANRKKLPLSAPKLKELKPIVGLG